MFIPRPLLFTLAVACLTAPPARAAEVSAGWVAESWSIDEGLPLDHVTDLAQTPDGVVWAATFDGLARLDGAAVRVLRRAKHPGLRSDRIKSLAVGPGGDLWLLSEYGDVARLRGGSIEAVDSPTLSWLRETDGELWGAAEEGLLHWENGRFERFAPALLGDRIVLPARAPDGAIWTATDGRGLARIAPDGGSRRVPVPGDAVDALAVGLDGSVWAVNGAGLSRASGDAAIHASWQGAAPDVRCRVLEGADGSMRVQTSEGWARIEGEQLVLDRSPRPPKCLQMHPQGAESSEGGWWIAGGRLHLDDTLVFNSEAVLSMVLPTDDGAVWVATTGDGLHRLRRAQVGAVSTEEGLPSPKVHSVSAGAGGGLWLAMDKPPELVHWRDGDTRRVSGPVKDMLSVLVDSRGDVWGGTSYGVCRVEGERCLPVPWESGEPGESVVLGLHEHLGTVVAAARSGVFRWDGDEAGWSEIADPEGRAIESARSLATAPDGSLLVGTAGRGLLRVGDGLVEARTVASGLSSDHIRGLTVSTSGVVWIGTESGGVCRLDLGGGVPFVDAPLGCLGSASGLPADTVHVAIEDEKQRLWLSTNVGLTVVRLESVHRLLAGESAMVLPLVLDEDDGMRSREGNGGQHPAGVRGVDGRLWFATQDGAVVVDPAAFTLPKPPSVQFGPFVVNDEVLSTRGGRLLSPEQRDVSVSWSAPEYRWPSQVCYRWRLIGYDDAWSIGHRETSASWTNLPPGDYSLEVQAGLAGSWGALATSGFSREPTFTETRRFLFILILAVVAMSGLLALGNLRSLGRRAEQLEETVASRTKELEATNARLAEQAKVLAWRGEQLESRNAEVRAQAARLGDIDSLRTNFVANVSHELRTPVGLIVGPLTDVLKQPGLPTPSRARLERARRNAVRLQDLVEQILDVARVDDGGIWLRARPLDLGVFVGMVSDRFSDAAEQAGLSLQVCVPPDPVRVYFDPDLLEKVFANLVGNALKFTSEGGVTVRLAAPDDDAAAVRVEVVDTGPGVCPEQRERIFERFFQGDGSSTRTQGGAGIGLALTRELVTLHGGEIGVDGVEEGGARFWFTLPRGADHLSPQQIDIAPSTRHIEPIEVAEPASANTGDRPLVVVAEDHPDMREYLVEHLGRRFDVFAAADGAAALQAIAVHRPAVVVSDVMMPELDGLQLCQHLRADPELASIQVMLVSARSSEADRVAGLELADDYLTKPFLMRELMARVDRLARREPLGSAGLPEAPPAPPPEPALSTEDETLRARFEAVISARLGEKKLGVGALAEAMGRSRRQLQRDVDRLFGLSPSELLRDRRMCEARSQLRAGSRVSEAAQAVGMSPSHFSRLYTAWAGHSPSAE